MWTTRHGALIGSEATVVQVDVEEQALGRNRPIAFGVVGDVRLTALAAAESMTARVDGGYRTTDVGQRIAAVGRWRDVAIEDTSTETRIDPRVLTTALDDILPDERVLATDSGNFQGYPSAFLSVPDEFGFCMTQAYQSIGLGLATTIGAALAQPDRLAVAALGDGGALMGVSELDTVVRLGLPMVVVVYNDDGYGAEVHHFGPDRSRPRDGRVPRHRHRRHLPRASASTQSPCATWPISTPSRHGSTGHASGRCWSTPKSSRTGRRGGWRRPFAATDTVPPGRPAAGTSGCSDQLAEVGAEHGDVLECRQVGPRRAITVEEVEEDHIVVRQQHRFRRAALTAQRELDDIAFPDGSLGCVHALIIRQRHGMHMKATWRSAGDPRRGGPRGPDHGDRSHTVHRSSRR